MDCLFCKIAKKEIPSSVVAETDNLLAFRDIEPQAPVHILIIPKKHISSTKELSKLNVEILGEMALLASEICKQENIEDGNRWIINTGAEGGQTVFHIHLHILGGRTMQWPPG
ncbi:MAG: histidine triad nucleotide-binding protein [Candidatus Marinimicrobia bacterium]|nr:histidine triad nucleotide-binding protein [Candidatus Neomarinimicrobiota bacterium]MBL7023611.1 histidine triad nucleotide-binding protein [Candidatus Neomarinimicrobiota bacterium]MBL7109891.1 histidine triad nucleotide-binding protein [Candidatus Neomarinimicrobiota bacterium]